MRLLLVEDERELADSLSQGLRLSGYAVDVASDGEEGLFMAQTEPYELILLDVNLPKMDGFKVLQEIRKENQTVAIILLTARGDVEDRVYGLDSGANDYLTKPFALAELEARIRSLLRRKTIQQDRVLSFGELSFDTRSREASISGEPVKLTQKETGILEYLLLNSDRWVSQDEIFDHVWDGEADVFSNACRVHLSALRRKLKDRLGYNPIDNQVGKGYCFQSERKV